MLHSIDQHIWKTQQWPQDWKRSVFIPIPNKDWDAKECSNYHTIAVCIPVPKGQFSSQSPIRIAMPKNVQTTTQLHSSHMLARSCSKARLQQYMNWELTDVKDRFWKGRRTRIQIANIHWIIDKAREFQKNIYFCFIDYANIFDYVDHNKLWKFLREIGIPDHLTSLLRNPYAGQ